MPTSYENRKYLAHKHPKLWDDWKNKSAKNKGYPPMYYWEKHNVSLPEYRAAGHSKSREYHQKKRQAKIKAGHHPHYVHHVGLTPAKVRKLEEIKSSKHMLKGLKGLEKLELNELKSQKIGM